MNIEIENFITTFDPLLNQTSDAVAVLDLNGDCHYGNESVKRFFGNLESDIFSSYFKDRIFASGNYFKFISGKLNTGGKFFHRERFVHPSDKKQNCFAGFLPLINQEKLHFGWSVVFNNRSHALAVERSLKLDSLLNCLNNLNKDACIVQNFETGEIVFVSNSFQDISGWSKQEIKYGGGLLFYLLLNVHDKKYILGIAELLKSKNKMQIEKTVASPFKLSTVLRKKNLRNVEIDLCTSIISLPEDPGVYYGISFMHTKTENIKSEGSNDTKRNLSLTNRESEIVSLLAKGYSSKMIANTHTLKEGYVSQIRKRLLKKFNVNNSPELVQLLNAEGYL